MAAKFPFEWEVIPEEEVKASMPEASGNFVRSETSVYLHLLYSGKEGLVLVLI